MQIFLICILIKQQKHVAINSFIINHTFYETNFKPILFTTNVECNGTVLKEPMMETSSFGSLSTLLYTSDLKWH